jgi:hypothetical protein
VTDDDKPKLDRPLFIAMNDSGEMESGPTMEQACGRLQHEYGSNLIRAAMVVVHMAPPTAEDCGDIIIPDAAGSVIKIEVRGR